VKQLVESMAKDPRADMFDSSDPNHPLNKPNHLDQTPLYIACQQGHFDVLKFLLAAGADPHIRSTVHKNDKEGLLEVSGRWSHIKIFEHLLTCTQWTKPEVQRLLKNKTISKAYKDLANDYKKSHLDKSKRTTFTSCLCICFCFKVDSDSKKNQVTPGTQ
jgi:ankyrin repeat protein